MIRAGLDIGSRTVKLVRVADGVVLDTRKASSVPDPLRAARALVADAPFDELVATGYGRDLARNHLGARTVTEIKAFARGARSLFPDARAVLDIGGQDTKVIVLSPAGTVSRFEMNDRCAAGTGRFLEVMASALGFSLDEFGRQALEAKGEAKVSSMCTVFAESEVVSLLARGEDPRRIAAGIHGGIMARTMTMARRVGAEAPLVFAGGGALNPCLERMLSRALGAEVLRTPDPQALGALGASLCEDEGSPCL